MKKQFLIIGLVLVIVATFGFTGIQVLAQGSNENYFNTHVRPILIKSGLVRTLLLLTDPGDARYEYLDQEHAEIGINVYAMSGETIDPSVFDRITETIYAVVGKRVIFSDVKTDIPYKNKLSEDEQQEIIETYYQGNLHPNTMFLFVFSQDSEEDDWLGFTYKDRSIVIFNDALKNFTNNHKEIFSAYQLSTLLHELGHQLGLDHNEIEGCLMNPKAEKNSIAKTDVAEIVVDFCAWEREELKSFLAR